MSRIVIDGQAYSGEPTMVGGLMLAILQLKRDGATHVLNFDGDGGRYSVLVSSATTAHLVIDEPGPIYDSYAPNVQDVLDEYKDDEDDEE